MPKTMSEYKGKLSVPHEALQHQGRFTVSKAPTLDNLTHPALIPYELLKEFKQLEPVVTPATPEVPKVSAEAEIGKITAMIPWMRKAEHDANLLTQADFEQGV
jgi:hypothetical protein